MKCNECNDEGFIRKIYDAPYRTCGILPVLESCSCELGVKREKDIEESKKDIKITTCGGGSYNVIIYDDIIGDKKYKTFQEFIDEKNT